MNALCMFINNDARLQVVMMHDCGVWVFTPVMDQHSGVGSCGGKAAGEGDSSGLPGSRDACCLPRSGAGSHESRCCHLGRIFGGSKNSGSESTESKAGSGKI